MYFRNILFFRLYKNVYLMMKFISINYFKNLNFVKANVPWVYKHQSQRLDIANTGKWSLGRPFSFNLRYFVFFTLQNVSRTKKILGGFQICDHSGFSFNEHLFHKKTNFYRFLFQ